MRCAGGGGGRAGALPYFEGDYVWNAGTTASGEYMVRIRAFDGAELAAVKDMGGGVTWFAYVGGHYLKDVVDPRGVRVARNEYDDGGRLVAVVDANGRRTEFDNDVEGRRQVVTDRLGFLTVYEYDEHGLILSVTEARGSKTENDYEEYGHIKSTKDALGNEKVFEHTPDGKLLSVTDAHGRETRRAYDARGALVSVAAPGDIELSFV